MKSAVFERCQIGIRYVHSEIIEREHLLHRLPVKACGLGRERHCLRVVFAYEIKRLPLYTQESFHKLRVFVIKSLGCGCEYGSGNKPLAVCNQMIAGRRAVVGAGPRQKGTVYAAAFKRSKGRGMSMRRSSRHRRSCPGGKIGRKQFVKIGALGACHGLAPQILRRINALVSGIQAISPRRGAVHADNLYIRTIGRGKYHRGAADGVRIWISPEARAAVWSAPLVSSE